MTLLMSAHDAVHETLVVDAMAQSKLVANLVAHDGAATHEKILFAVIVFDSVVSRIIPFE